VSSDAAAVSTKPTAGVVTAHYSDDEQQYYRVCDGVVSLRRVADLKTYKLVVCSATEAAPMLVDIVSSLSLQTMNKPTSQNIGK